MKSLGQPRAVLLFPRPEEGAIARQTLKLLDIEGYEAPDLDSLIQRASRLDTMLVMLDATGLPGALSAIADIRKDAKSHDVLVVVFAPEAELQPFLDAGAHVAQGAPATPTGVLSALLRIVRRQRPAAEPGERTLEAQHVPLEVLGELVQKRMAPFNIYLGAAPGVGKTYAMLAEAKDHQRRGDDVVVGLVETHGRRDTLDAISGLEVLPRRVVDYKGTRLDEMDVDAILARRPALALVDELAHTNIPGSVNKKRYEDVNVLRLAGIQVITTLNVQHIESLNNVVERITGVKVRETVPDALLEEAGEVVLVDLEPQALQKRLQAGKIYAPEKITQSLSNFFTTHNLTALRELVLRELADRVDERLEAVRASIGKAHEATGIQDRMLVCITPTDAAERVIRRGARLADRINAELVIVYVETRPLVEDEARALTRLMELAETFDAPIVRLKHPEAANAIARYATEHKITMIVMGETRKARWKMLMQPSVFEALLDKTANIDIVTVATHP